MKSSGYITNYTDKLNDLVNSGNISSELTYIYIKKLCVVALMQQGWRTSNKQATEELSHVVASNIYFYLNRVIPTGFKMVNWFRFIYNKTIKTSMALFSNSQGNIRPQIFDLDVVQSDEFIRNMYANQLNLYTELIDSEFWDMVGNIGKILEEYIEKIIRYTKTYEYYNLVYTSVLLSCILNKPITLYGMPTYDKYYCRSLSNYVRSTFFDYFKQNFLNEMETLDLYLPEIKTSLLDTLEWKDE